VTVNHDTSNPYYFVTTDKAKYQIALSLLKAINGQPGVPSVGTEASISAALTSAYAVLDAINVTLT